MISDLSAVILTRLKNEIEPKRSALVIEEFPSEVGDFRRFSQNAILSRFVTLAEQNRQYVYQYDIHILSRKLSKDGIYPLIESVVEALEDYKPEMVGVSKLTLLGVEFNAYEEGVWHYTVRYTINVTKR